MAIYNQWVVYFVLQLHAHFWTNMPFDGNWPAGEYLKPYQHSISSPPYLYSVSQRSFQLLEDGTYLFRCQWPLKLFCLCTQSERCAGSSSLSYLPLYSHTLQFNWACHGTVFIVEHKTRAVFFPAFSQWPNSISLICFRFLFFSSLILLNFPRNF